ncbi:MAG: DedA family protein, partial [Phycisphaerae bacterium]
MQWAPHASYLGILLALLAAGFGVPIPEDIPLLTAGYLCHLGQTNLWLMLPLTLTGVLGCDIILYRMGLRLGDHVLEHRWTRRLFRRGTLVTAKAQFRRHGAKIVFAGRFMPGARAVIFVSAGIVGMRWWKFLLVDGTAALISVPTLVLLGWYFGEKSEALLARVRHAEYYIMGGILAATVVAIAVESYLARRRKAKELAAEGLLAQADTAPAENPATRAEPSSDRPTRQEPAGPPCCAPQARVEK